MYPCWYKFFGFSVGAQKIQRILKTSVLFRLPESWEIVKTLSLHNLRQDPLGTQLSRKLFSIYPRVKSAYKHMEFTLVILDEGGMFLKTTSDTDQYLAFLRKSNIYIIVPSVKEPHRDLRILSCERLFNAQKIGFKGWVYQYLLRTALVKETEKFFWPNPSEVYGIYDTDARPVDDFGISDWLIYHKEKAVEKYYGEHQRRVKSYENKEGPDGVRAMEGAGRWAELFYEAAQEIRAASEAVSLPDQKRQSGRK